MKDNNTSAEDTNLSEELTSSISEDAKLDAIVNFYKDKPAPETDKITIDNEDHDNESVNSDNYGLNHKHRTVTGYIITALICIVVLGGSYVLAINLPGDTEKVSEYADELRNDDDYISLSNQHKSLSHEVSELRASNKAKKAKIDNITDYDNTKAALRSEIAQKSVELNTFNAQMAEKRAAIEALNAVIAQKTPSVITLNAGKYIIGTNIAAGKYRVTGVGTFSAASSDNISKYNFSLKDGAQEVTLNKGDIIKINSTTQFTSVN